MQEETVTIKQASRVCQEWVAWAVKVACQVWVVTVNTAMVSMVSMTMVTINKVACLVWAMKVAIREACQEWVEWEVKDSSKDRAHSNSKVVWEVSLGWVEWVNLEGQLKTKVACPEWAVWVNREVWEDFQLDSEAPINISKVVCQVWVAQLVCMAKPKVDLVEVLVCLDLEINNLI